MIFEKRVANGDGSANGDGTESFKDSLGAKNGGINGFLDCSTCVVGQGNSTVNSDKALLTYKRRKKGMRNSEFKVSQSDEHSSDAALANAQSQDKMIELVDLGLQINCPSVLNGSDNCPYYHPWRNILEYVCRAPNTDKDGAGSTSDPQTQVTSDGHSQGHTLGASTRDGSSNGAERPVVINSNGTKIDLSKLTVTKWRGIAFLKLIMSEKFASLRTLFRNNFHGLEVDKFLDFNLIISRMTEGTYEQKPNLFYQDVQQFWRKLRTVGAEMVSLSMSLSELSTFFFLDPVSGIGDAASDDGKHKFPAWCSEWHSNLEQPSSSSRPCTCRCCGGESDGRDFLVCDSCEEIFHVACIKPPVKEIPHKDWYCASCIATGVEAPHVNCAVCSRLDAFAGPDEETVDGLEESSGFVKENVFQVFKGGKKEYCQVCKSVLEVGDVFRDCEHHCCFRHYHKRCLTKRQLKSYGPRWYCPCCLCRVCLTDKDDSKIVLCDACDHGYHTYCLNPPLDSVPEDKWFCRKCHAGIQAINKVKRTVEEQQMKEGGKRKRVNARHQRKQNRDCKKAVDRSGGMDMLLSAADTLKFQEQLASLSTKS